MSLSQDLSQLLLDHTAKSAGTEPFVALDPVDLRMWERAIHGAYNALRSKGWLPIVMCSSMVRRLVWTMTNREMPDIIVISDREIIAAGRSIKIEVLGEIAEDKAGVTIQNV